MTTKKTAEEAEGARAFNNAIMLLDNGRVHAELSEKLHGLVCKLRDEAINRDRAIAGELSLTLKIGVDEHGNVEVIPAIKVVEPKAKQARTVLFLTRGGNLSVENPRQQSLPLRDVSAPETRDVNSGAAVATREV